MKRINWQLVLELMVFAVGVKVACIYSHQLKAMLDSNEINRDSLYSVQRPFIISHGIKKKMNTITNPDGMRKKSFEFTTEWENAGNTPAVGVVSLLGVVMQEDELTEPEFMGTAFDKSVLKAASSMIGPKAPFESGITHQPEEFATNDLDVPRFFWGWLIYRDTFPKTKPHVTEFCLKSTKIKQEGADYSFDATVCGHHNCVDEFCEDYTTITQLVSKD